MDLTLFTWDHSKDLEAWLHVELYDHRFYDSYELLKEVQMRVNTWNQIQRFPPPVLSQSKVTMLFIVQEYLSQLSAKTPCFISDCFEIFIDTLAPLW